MDTRTPVQRRRIMQAVKSRHTAPELRVRKLVFGLGYRYRIHCKELPGTPDLVFKGKKKVIFVNGCYWHGHSCNKGRLPKSNCEFWSSKIAKNRERDERNLDILESEGWSCLTIWQCELKDQHGLEQRVADFLCNQDNKSIDIDREVP